MYIVTKFNKIKCRTTENELNLEDFLNKYSKYTSKQSNLEEISFYNASVKDNPRYVFGEGPREIDVIVRYLPVKRISSKIREVGSHQEILKLKFHVDSKQGIFFKQYILTKIN